MTTTGQPAARAEAVSPPGDRKGEREVRRAEHGDRADRALDQLEVRARRGLAVGQRRVVAAVEPVVLQDMGGEQAQLHGRAAALALQPGGGQAGFLGADLGDLGAARLDLIGDAVQESGAFGAGSGGIGGEGGLGGFAGRVDMGRGADGEVRAPARGPGRRGRSGSPATQSPAIRCFPVSMVCLRERAQIAPAESEVKASVMIRRPRVRASATWTIGARSTSRRAGADQVGHPGIKGGVFAHDAVFARRRACRRSPARCRPSAGPGAPSSVSTSMSQVCGPSCRQSKSAVTLPEKVSCAAIGVWRLAGKLQRGRGQMDRQRQDLGQDRQRVDAGIEDAHAAGLEHPVLAGMPFPHILAPGDVGAVARSCPASQALAGATAWAMRLCQVA